MTPRGSGTRGDGDGPTTPAAITLASGNGQTGEVGTVNPATSSTDSAGNASTPWTLGPTAGSNHATATVAGLAPVTVNATAVAGNAIARVTVTSPTSTPHEGDTVQLTAILVTVAVGGKDVVFDWTTDHSEPSDAPDGPADTGILFR